MESLINEIITYLQSTNLFQTINIWNNQFDYIDEGSSYSFAMPCAFIELNNNNSQDIGGKYQGSDVKLNIHLGNDVYNSDNFEVNHSIYTLRNDTIKALSTFKPTTSSPLIKTSEEQDYQHSNVYHYILNYKLHWIDATAVPTDTLTTPPIDLNITI